MRVIKPFALGVLSRAIEVQRKFFLGIAATTFCPMGETPGIAGDIAMWKFLAETLPPTEPLDIVLPKPQAEFLMTGDAFAPGGRPMRAVQVSARLGPASKTLMVVGDRHLEDGRATEPVPFTRMAMGWDRAYGGAKIAENPLGCGIEEKPLPGIGFRVPLPNVVSADRAAAAQAPQPVGFGAIDIAWPQRTRLAGTHDARWLEEDFPGFARDINWRIFMAASPDQRFASFLRGDEPYAIENMHPEEPTLVGRLPGIAPRVFIERKGRPGLEEVPLNLTTVWFFPNAKRLVMIHHGQTRVAEEDGRDVERLIIGADRLGEKRPVAHFQAVMTKRLDPDKGAAETLRDSDLVPAELLLPESDLMPTPDAGSGVGRQRRRRRQAKEVERGRQLMRDQKLDPDEHGLHALPPDEPPPSLDQIPAHMERMLAEMEQRKAEGEALRMKAQAVAKEQGEAHNVALDVTAKPFGPPEFSADAQRQAIRMLAELMEAHALDSSAFRGMLADAAQMALLDKAEATMREGYRRGAHTQDPARRVDAPVNAALRARLMDGSRAAPRMNLCGTDLAGGNFEGFDFTEAWLDGADLTRAVMTRAKLARAVLAHARLDGAQMAGADFQGANLGRASARGANFQGARLRDAVLSYTDLRDANLRRANLSGARLLDTPLAGADISEVRAAELLVHGGSIAGLRATGASLEQSMFLKVDMAGVDFTQARMHRVTFLGVQAKGLVARGADMSKAIFVEGCDLTGADFTGANCVMANFRGTCLAGARFDGAMLEGADFSDCDLTGASFDLARGREARFVVADLRGAAMTRADLRGASLARADLRGANLSDASLYEADLARIHADPATRYDRVQRTRTKLVPRRTPA
ncbi:MAG: DUF2169 domain-containing protein [Pseudomonadota bacterium]